MRKTIKDIPVILNRNNIEQAITNYKSLLYNIPLKFEAKTVLEMLTNLKRKDLEFGPYPEVTLFESANRIMSDLTILYGIKRLFEGAIPEIDFDEYKVEYGHDNENDHDIMASKGKIKLIGEGFNVAESYFGPKKTSALKKMRLRPTKYDQLLLIYNSDAVSKTYTPKPRPNEFHLKVKLDFVQ